MLTTICCCFAQYPKQKETDRELLWHRSGGCVELCVRHRRKGPKTVVRSGGDEKAAFERLVEKFRLDGLSIAIEAGNQTAWVYDELVTLGAKVTVVNPAKVKLIAESRRKTDKIDAKILMRVASARRVASPGTHTGAGGPCVARAAGGPPATRGGSHQVVQRGTRHAAADGRAFAGRGAVQLAGWKRLFAAGFEHDHLLAHCDGLPRQLHGLDQVNPRTGSATRRTGEERTSCAAVENDAQGGPHRLSDIPGRRGRCEPLPHRRANWWATRAWRRRCGRAANGRSTARSAAKAAGSCGPCGCRSLIWWPSTKCDTQPLRTWFNRVAKKRGKKTAVVGLARRLLVIAYHLLLKSESDYDVGRLKKKRQAA